MLAHRCAEKSLRAYSPPIYQYLGKLFGHLFNYGLYGVASVQICKTVHALSSFTSLTQSTPKDNYYLNFGSDPKGVKIFSELHLSSREECDNLPVCRLQVYSIYLIETLQITLASHDAWQVFAVGWGDPVALNSPQWLWFDTPVLSGIGGHRV